MKRKRIIHSDDFKADAVRLFRSQKRGYPLVAADLGISESALRNWVALDETAKASPSPDALSTAEREELLQLRKDNRRLLMEREILKKATAFFARENA